MSPPPVLSGGYSNTPAPLAACGQFRRESRTLPHDSWPAVLPPGAGESLAPESVQCVLRSPVIRGYWQSWQLRDNLDNASVVPLAGDLPVGQRGLLILKHRQASQPKHTGAKPCLGHRMLKEQPGLSGELRDVKCILHQEEDIDIIGDRLGRHKRPEDDTAGKVACGPRHIVNAFESQAD